MRGDHVEGDEARDPDGALVPCRASPVIVQMKMKRMINREQRTSRDIRKKHVT